MLLVAGSVVIGARLLAAADDTVTVWAVTDARGSGSPVGEQDLSVVRVRFDDDAALERYFAADQPVPDGLVLTRPVGAGELLARSAVGAADDAALIQVPLAVDPQRVPPDVTAGSVVNVWIDEGAGGPVEVAEPARGRDEATSEEPGAALTEVTVVAAPAFDDTFAVSGTRQVVIAVDEQAAADFERLLASFQDPLIRIHKRV